MQEAWNQFCAEVLLLETAADSKAALQAEYNRLAWELPEADSLEPRLKALFLGALGTVIVALPENISPRDDVASLRSVMASLDAFIQAVVNAEDRLAEVARLRSDDERWNTWLGLVEAALSIQPH